jgi:hypothetical protein
MGKKREKRENGRGSNEREKNIPTLKVTRQCPLVLRVDVCMREGTGKNLSKGFTAYDRNVDITFRRAALQVLSIYTNPILPQFIVRTIRNTQNTVLAER